MLSELETLGMRSMVGTVFKTTKSRKIQRWMDGNIAHCGSEKVDEVSSRITIGVEVVRGALLVRIVNAQHYGGSILVSEVCRTSAPCAFSQTHRYRRTC
jgi:hypothetical protein